jgi:hypothetical protein
VGAERGTNLSSFKEKKEEKKASRTTILSAANIIVRIDRGSRKEGKQETSDRHQWRLWLWTTDALQRDDWTLEVKENAKGQNHLEQNEQRKQSSDDFFQFETIDP